MKWSRVAFAGVGVVLFSLGSVLPVGAQDLTAAVTEFVRDIGSYIGTVSFAEPDVQSFLEHWQEVAAVIEDPAEEYGAEEAASDVAAGLREARERILGASSNPAFQAWAASRGLDAGDWMRKSMRILVYTQQRAMDEQFAAMDVDAEMADVESQRATLGDEATDGILDSLRGMVAMKDAFAALPPASADEKALIDSYWPQLMEALTSGDEEMPQ